MGLVGEEGEGVVEGVGGFDAEHGGPGVVVEIGHGFAFVDPGIPEDGGEGAGFVGDDAAVPGGIFESDGGGGVEIDAIGFLGDGDGDGRLGEAGVVLRFGDVGAVVEAKDADLMDVADVEIGVQGVGNGDRIGGEIGGGEGKRKMLGEEEGVLEVEVLMSEAERNRETMIGMEMSVGECPG